MIEKFLFPDIGEGLEEGRIQEWLVSEGQFVHEDEPLVTVETDKVVTDLPSPYTGQITKLHGNAGEEIHVGDVLVEFEVEGDETSSSAGDAIVTSVVEEEGAGVVGQIEIAGKDDILPASREISSESKEKKSVLATPVVRQMAKVHGIDISSIKGSGQQGRIYKEDIERYLLSSSEPKTFTHTNVPTSDIKEQKCEFEESQNRVKISTIRKTIAANMLKARSEAAHITVLDEVEVSQLSELRDKFKAEFQERGTKLTYLSFVVKATALALQQFPVLNAYLEGDEIVYNKEVHMGIAVDSPQGLVVPVLRSVQQKTLYAIAEEIMIVAEEAREGKLSLEKMRGGTFTITSFGSIGGRFATPILNRPQSAILGIGKVSKQPVVIDNELAVGLLMPLSLSVDHCIADGGEISRFLTLIMEYLNDPLRMVIG